MATQKHFWLFTAWFTFIKVNPFCLILALICLKYFFLLWQEESAEGLMHIKWPGAELNLGPCTGILAYRFLAQPTELLQNTATNIQWGFARVALHDSCTGPWCTLSDLCEANCCSSSPSGLSSLWTCFFLLLISWLLHLSETWVFPS